MRVSEAIKLLQSGCSFYHYAFHDNRAAESTNFRSTFKSVLLLAFHSKGQRSRFVSIFDNHSIFRDCNARLDLKCSTAAAGYLSWQLASARYQTHQTFHRLNLARSALQAGFLHHC